MEPAVTKYDFLGLLAVVASPRMQRTLALAERAARTNATVLISGESGSGKEVIARAIHQMSPRAGHAWVDVNCGALPEQLMESELFGHERGAFSSAEAAKPGLFELAHHGTIFLDEVGELDPRMQVKLLRVLDGATYFRLGGTRKIEVDVRVVAATNIDLRQAVGKGKFREDLYHRLSIIRIEVPPLRERPEDIIPLAQHFLWLQGDHKRLSPGALQALQEYDWPGNVRELRNVMLRAAILSDSDFVLADHLGLAGEGTGPSAHLRREAAVGGAGASLGVLERQAILSILKQTNGHRQRAADLLGISRRTLSRKLKQYSAEAEHAGLSEEPVWRKPEAPWIAREEINGKRA
jgi:Transcriptional regulator containing PAS, AAA-type ATPase, and DNA-binding domains